MKDEIKMIPIDQIRILNPRHRERKRFEIIVQSIRNLGLKKPIQVSLRSKNEEGGPGYDLVCGQGRIEAFNALGCKEIPAVVVEVTKEDRLLRSLIENLARRHPATLDLIREIERLKTQGYSHAEIGGKLDISKATIKGLMALKRAGEERLIEAAIAGRVPVTVAIEIARAQTAETQRALLTAYEDNQLTHVSIRAVKRLIDQRRFFGKKFNQVGRHPRKNKTTAENLVILLKREGERQKLLIKKAKICETKLVFIVTAFDKLLADENFVTLLRAESLANMPKHLWSKLTDKHKEAA